MPALSIRRPGMFTTVQDLGRWGFQSRGVPVSGAMDRYSHVLANRLAGNPDTAATLEVTLLGPEIGFDTDTAIAVTGAVFGLTLDGIPFEMNHLVQAEAGSTLKFGARRQGARAYVAVAGGVDVPEVMGSRSTHVLTGMGGFHGRALRAGDRIQTGSNIVFSNSVKMGSDPLCLPRGGARVRVLPGEPQLFDPLASQRFQISPQSDRMGYRLEGSAIGSVPSGELTSSAVVTGAVQVTPSGQPIVLMADRATTGGYAIAATVIAADLPLVAQLAPGDWIEFEGCTLEAADTALREQEAALGGG
jgi:antagonist of KipI